MGAQGRNGQSAVLGRRMRVAGAAVDLLGCDLGLGYRTGLVGVRHGMNLLQKERRAIADLTIAMTIGLLLAFLSVTLNFSNKLHAFFSDYITAATVSWIVNGLFLWLVFMLTLAYRRWRHESRRRSELEDVLSSISPDALVVVSPSRRIEMCNNSVERLLGYRPDEVIGQMTDLLYHDRRRDRTQKGEIHDALERGGFHIGTAIGRRKDGREVPLEIITGELSGRGGAVLLLRDISERVAAERERQELESRVRQRQKLESLGVLAGGIAHDFNNLLMGILGNAELVLAGLEPQSRLHRSAQGIKTAATRAAELCRSLLAYSGRGSFVRQPVNVTELVREMAELLSISISKHSRVEYNMDPDIPPIEADPAQLRQVVMNFITNASDACGGRENAIVLRTGLREYTADSLRGSVLDVDMPPGPYVFIEVADQGTGIDDPTLARIFDPFFTTKVTGRGLGLSAVLGIVRGHGGNVLVVSRVGEGSVFTVLFPPMPMPDKPPAAPPSPPRQHFHGSILLVDDEEIVRTVGLELLEYLGFMVTAVENGREAVQAYGRSPGVYSAVLLDLTMPGLSGAETLAELRRIDPNVIVVLSSGYTREASMPTEPHLRPAAFIEKPYQLDALRKTFSAVLPAE